MCLFVGMRARIHWKRRQKSGLVMDMKEDLFHLIIAIHRIHCIKIRVTSGGYKTINKLKSPYIFLNIYILIVKALMFQQ
jgi:hypothetical protein